MEKRIAVKSTTIRSLRYLPAKSELEIEFTSGDIYRYAGVPAAEYKALLTAGSLGRQFNCRIRDRYSYQHL